MVFSMSVWRWLLVEVLKVLAVHQIGRYLERDFPGTSWYAMGATKSHIYQYTHQQMGRTTPKCTRLSSEYAETKFKFTGYIQIQNVYEIVIYRAKTEN